MSGARDQPPGRRPGGLRSLRAPVAGALLLTLLVGAPGALGASATGASTGSVAAAATASPSPTVDETGPTDPPVEETEPDGTGEDETGEDEVDDPLAVTLTTISPAAIPERGPVTVTGTVSNDSIETWSDVNVYALTSDAPITATEELDEAAASPSDAVIGERIVEPDRFATLGDLLPGTSRSFRISLPRDLLPDAGDGVYWLGLQALGANEDGRDDIADGRTRTFLPLVGDPGGEGTDTGTDEVRTALVLPVRQPVRRDSDGKVRNLRAWADALRPDGRLDRLLDFAAEADDVAGAEVTWLLDPSVPDTVAELVAGNRGLTIGPTVGRNAPGRGRGTGGSPSASPTASPDATADDTDPDDGGVPTDPEDAATLARIARAGGPWLQQLRAVLGSGSVLTLPYGDLDVDASARLAPSLYERARLRSAQVTATQDVTGSRPVVAPASGLLDPDTLPEVADADTVVVSDEALPGAGPASRAVVGGREVVVSASGPADGVPGPGDPLAAVAVRQRLLGEAALRLVSGSEAGTGPATLVATMPDDWDPAAGTGFFAGLADVDWFDLAPVDEVAGDAPATTVASEELVYPPSARASEPGRAAMAAAEALVATAGTLQDVLPLNDTVAAQALDEALVALSYGNREQRGLRLRAIDQTRRHLEGYLGEIDVEAPTELTLSSDDGEFSVTLTNGLDQPVLVRLRAVTDGLVEVTAPEQVEIGARTSTSVPMSASSVRDGVATVDVVLTDSDGNATGTSDQLPVRSVQIGDVIWWILGVGSTLLFGTILLRVLRRARAGRRAASAG